MNNVFLRFFSQTKLARAEPVDFEAFVTKNRTVMLNDADREMLLFPLDDISVSVYPFYEHSALFILVVI